MGPSGVGDVYHDGPDGRRHPGRDIHLCWDCKLVNMMDAIREASDSQLVILNQAISKWKGRYYTEAVKAATQRAHILELQKPSTAPDQSDYIDSKTGKVKMNPAAWMPGADGKPACPFHAVPLVYHADGKYGPFYSCNRTDKDGNWCKSKVGDNEFLTATNL